MTNETEILAQKRAWSKCNLDRRNKDGSIEDRKLTADCIRSGRSTDKRKEDIERNIQKHVAILFIIICIWATLILLFAQTKAHAQTVDMDAIAEIESSGDPLAKNGDHIGLYQLSEGVVIDFNNYYSKRNLLDIKDMYNPSTARIVANYYMNVRIPEYLSDRNIPDTITSRIIAWNYGIGHLRKWFKNGSHWNRLPRETRNYVKRYFREVNQ